MTVVFPFCRADVHLLIDLLLWIEQLGGAKKHRALLVGDPAVDWRDSFEALARARLCFEDTELLCPDKSVEGWPQGANALWRTAARHCREHSIEPWFFMEPDAVPIVPGWADGIAAEYKPSMFMGEVYIWHRNGTQKHVMSGIASYPADAERFLSPDETRAFDVAISESARLRIERTFKVQHVYGDIGLAPTFTENQSLLTARHALPLSAIRPDTLVFHRNKDSTLIRLLREKRGIKARRNLHVVLPVCRSDLAIGLKHLGWIHQMCGKVHATAILHIDKTITDLRPVEAAARNAFSDVTVSRYERAPKGGWPDACNWAFKWAALYMEHHVKQPWLWIEPDACAVKPDWLERITQEYYFARKPFMGAIVGNFERGSCGHMNGVAVYPGEVSRYGEAYLTCMGEAWDTAMRREFGEEGMFRFVHRANHLISQASPGLQFNSQSDVDREVAPTLALFHPIKNGTLVDRLAQRLGQPIKPMPMLDGGQARIG